MFEKQYHLIRVKKIDKYLLEFREAKKKIVADICNFFLFKICLELKWLLAISINTVQKYFQKLINTEDCDPLL